jgi:hypothetical protein
MAAAGAKPVITIKHLLRCNSVGAITHHLVLCTTVSIIFYCIP